VAAQVHDLSCNEREATTLVEGSRAQASVKRKQTTGRTETHTRAALMPACECRIQQANRIVSTLFNNLAHRQPDGVMAADKLENEQNPKGG